MSFFLAIDAGGTKTDYALADETHVLARVRSGTIKLMRTDASVAATNLDGALAELSEATGVAMQAVTRTCIGTAGEVVPLVANWLRQAFSVRVGGELLLLGDVEIALDAAFPGQAGVLVLAGTGSNVAGRTEAGLLSTVGGWGPALADQGSGHRIGHEGLRAAFLARDEGRSTQLLEAILAFWQLSSIGDLVEFANSRPAPDFSRLTEVVLRCAELGDEVASAVLRQQGEELAYLVQLMMRRLKASSTTPGWTPSIAFAGSIMEKIPSVREALLAAVRLEFPDADALAGVVDPVDGAVARARMGRI
ncbi:BadF/BadG/BcrA/BcrD ATPase family protein [Granulicella sp. dw_53]|uniref:N-acetylglucosamine kinase n=1 Tax=Granulicella sp. dw_53 TaxID=2719792 RepID=UPI001BD4866A|nr:BadF/BadG/BcrA/BcrD ATPase family protein [Granulicella sp. dw_53]